MRQSARKRKTAATKDSAKRKGVRTGNVNHDAKKSKRGLTREAKQKRRAQHPHQRGRRGRAKRMSWAGGWRINPYQKGMCTLSLEPKSRRTFMSRICA